MSDSDPKPGPASPRAEGATAPTPPGGPQRQDSAGSGLVEGDTGSGEQAADSVEDAHGGTIDVEDEQPDPSPASERSEETAEQRENTEASTEQPSQ